ncbi:hypothetical protein ADL12_20040 [Streptomyces regalis]|uniref:MASE1 domain-containing protein n=1 Tax=Streptomyces regalis TaxID=68262 RepID=A0A0X3UX17_9ACTN|nr:hypothetical protein ADL12_20040 [Streptomyces regalis]
MVRFEDLRRPAATGLAILAVAAAYYTTGRLGLLAEVVVGGAHITPLWPPTGVALACLLILGLRIWPGIALGAFLVVVAIGSLTLTPSSLAITAGNTAGPLAACLLLRRVGFRTELDRLKDGLALVFLGAAGMLVSSGTGAVTLLLDGGLPPHGFWAAWSAWWTGDVMGVVVITPLLLSLRMARPAWGAVPHAWAEQVVLLAATAVVAVVVTRSSLDLLFLVFPLLIWAALRFQLAATAPCVLVLSVLAVVAATGHHGPFKDHGILGIMVTLQALNGAAALTTLLLAAVVAQRENTYQKIEQACAALSEVVAHLSPTQPRSSPPGSAEETT